MDLDQQIAAASAHAPPGMMAVHYSFPRWEGDSALISFGVPGRRDALFDVTLDPATDAVNGISSIPKTIAFLRHFHTDLLLLPYGETATSIMGVLLFVMAMTGVVLWWPRPDLWRSGKWRKTIAISRKARGYRLWREIHLTVGFWTALVLAFMSASGALLAFPGSRGLFGMQDDRHGHGRHAAIEMRRHREDAGLAPEHTRPLVIKDIVSAAHDLLPSAVLTDIQLNASPGGVRIRAEFPELGSQNPVMMQVGPHGMARILHDPRSEPVRARFFEWLHIVHEGKLGQSAWLEGPLVVTLAMTGTALVVFTISGWMMWLRRRAARRSRAGT